MAESGIISMANGMSQHALLTGYRCWCKAGNSHNDAQAVGFVDNMRATKQIQLQRAQVCGAIMPASIDPQSINISVNLGGFVASPGVYTGTQAINGLGTVSLASFNPDSDDFIQGTVAVKFPYMEFVDEKSGIIIASFEDVIASSFAVTIQGGSYVKADIQLEALKMSSGADYQKQAGTEIDANQNT